MKIETLIYEKIRPIIPSKSEKTIFFASISQTNYEVFFYAFIDGRPIQCFKLAEQENLDENELDSVFESIVNIIKESKCYKKDKYNIATIIIDKLGVKMSIKYYDKGARMYKVKKEWEQNHINI